MSAALLVDAGSSSAAGDIETEALAGALWGVNLGTTSLVSSYSDAVLILATWTRIGNLEASLPEGVETIAVVHDIDSFSSGNVESKLWFLYGKAQPIP